MPNVPARMNSPDKALILSRIAETRVSLAEDCGRLAEVLDVPSRVRRSFRLHPLAWVSASVAVGALLGSFLRRGGRHTTPGEGWAGLRPLILGAMGYAGNQLMTLSLPALKELLEAELLRWTQRRQATPPPSPGAEAFAKEPLRE